VFFENSRVLIKTWLAGWLKFWVFNDVKENVWLEKSFEEWGFIKCIVLACNFAASTIL